MENQEFQDVAVELAKGVSAYMRSTAEHLCEVSQMSGIGLSDLLIDLALLARAAERKKEERDVAVSEKTI